MRVLNRLTDRTVKSLTKPGMHADGGGLYCFVDKTGSKRWSFVFQWHKVRKEMGLGGTHAVSLQQARKKAEEARALVAKGFNPVVERKRAVVKAQTFGQVAEELLTDLGPQWRNPKHRDQWKMHLTVLAKPLRDIPVDQIETDDVLRTLRPIWTKTPETASRVRSRIERVLDAAKAKNLRSGDNPARWKGHLDLLLAKRKTSDRKHHAAMPVHKVNDFIARLRTQDGVAPRALEFAILTAARSGEVLGAQWSEFDVKKRTWTIPAGRMKGGKEHRVPLTRAMLRVLIKVKPLKNETYVFPGAARKKPLSNMAMEMTLRRMEEPYTVHGFRSTFRDWVADETLFQREVAEAALSHAVGDRVEQAYRRGDALVKRRQMMDAWAAFCTTPKPPSGKR